MSIDVGDAVLKITADDSDLKKSLSGLGSKIGSISKGIGIGLAAIGTAAVGMGVASVKSFADAGSEIYDMSKRTGMGAKALSEYKYMAEQSGASLGSVEVAAKRMAVAITEASQGSEAQASAFKNLGLSIEDLKAMTPEEQFKAITTAISNIQDPTAKAAAAVDIFGRSGTDLLSMLSEGEAGMDAMRQKAQELGVVFTEETAAKADVLGDGIADMEKGMKGLMNEIALALMPAIMPLIDAFQELIKALPIKEIAELIKGLLPPLVDLMLKLLKAIPVDTMIKFVTSALTPMLKILESLLPILEPILFIFGKLMELLTPVLDVLGKVLSFIAQILGSGITSILSGITSLFGGKMTEFKMPSFAGFEGIVPGIPGTPIPAIVHAGEYIGQGGGVTNTFNISQLVVREAADVQRIARELERMQRTAGRQYGS